MLHQTERKQRSISQQTPERGKIKMDVEKLFHMNGGASDTSYAKNSSLQPSRYLFIHSFVQFQSFSLSIILKIVFQLQRKASDSVKYITLEAIQHLYQTPTIPTTQSIGVADLGCSSGPNTLSIIKDIIDALNRESRKYVKPATKEIRIYLNDLPSNDFNSIFMDLPDFYNKLKTQEKSDINRCPSVFIAAYPGSCYGRIFPHQCLHFVYSSYCLHWLSKVPPSIFDGEGKSINKGSMYISERSPPEVSRAYLKQFQEDASLFLRSRSEEVVEGGRMVLILLGRSGADHIDRGNSFFWQLLSRAFSALVSQGLVEEEKVDSYDVHFYAPNKDEIINEVKKEGSFETERFEMFEIEKDEKNNVSYGTSVAMTVRAIQESMISYHFGESILDNLFETYGRIIDEEIAIDDIKPITFVLVLKKAFSPQ